MLRSMWTRLTVVRGMIGGYAWGGRTKSALGVSVFRTPTPGGGLFESKGECTCFPLISTIVRALNWAFLNRH